MNNKKRITLLFGAGAVIDWGGPKTPILTKLVRDSGFICSDNKTKITDFIYQSLKKCGYNESEINFETIINVIEELIVHYALFNKKEKTPSLSEVFFSSRFEKHLCNFSIKGGKLKNGYELEIPKGKEYKYQQGGAINGETPAQYFFQLLLAEILTSINGIISKYSYHTNGKTKVLTEKNTGINALFQNWIRMLNKGDTSILRMYTLNYDRLFKVLSLKAGLGEVFEGFECEEPIEPGLNFPANIPRILSDFDCNCHYNLHGSAFWTVATRDSKQLPNAEIFFRGVPVLQINSWEQPYTQIEKGKSILISNIIAGYQKAQKGYLAPFKQMHAAFDRDCMLSDDLYIIGYSFSDEHINMSIKTTLKNNATIKIHLIDPVYDEREGNSGYETLQKRFIDVFTNYLNRGYSSKKISETKHEYWNGKVTVHTIGMREFLENF